MRFSSSLKVGIYFLFKKRLGIPIPEGNLDWFTPTSTGKTYAVWAPPLMDWMDKNPNKKKAPRLKILWLTPPCFGRGYKRSLNELVNGLELSWTVESRTGDLSSALKAKQRKKFPSALVTTPESLSLLLSYSDTKDSFSELEAVIVDEWHELLSTKRGTQTELCLARLRKWNPNLKTWGLSATLGNLQQAMCTLLGENASGVLVNGGINKKFIVKTVIPSNMENFLGLDTLVVD